MHLNPLRQVGMNSLDMFSYPHNPRDYSADNAYGFSMTTHALLGSFGISMMVLIATSVWPYFITERLRVRRRRHSV